MSQNKSKSEDRNLGPKQEVEADREVKNIPKQAGGSSNVISCWGCGAKEEEGKARAKTNPDDPEGKEAPSGNQQIAKFKSCPCCIEENRAPARFCSRECQKESWPRHMKWHKETDAVVPPLITLQYPIDESQEGKAKRDILKSKSEYFKYRISGDEHFERKEYDKASKLFIKAIKLDLDLPYPHRKLAIAFWHPNIQWRNIYHILYGLLS